MRNFFIFLKKDWLAMLGFLGIASMVFIAVFAPILANGRPLFLYENNTINFPFLYFIFAPDTTEIIVEKVFNYLLLLIPTLLPILFIVKSKKIKLYLILAFSILYVIPFFLFSQKLEKTNWRDYSEKLKGNDSFVIFAPVKYGPYENITEPFQKPNSTHLLGTDQIGRDTLSRMIYGARVSLAVGFFATGIALVIGTIVGLTAGYYGGKIDLLLMRCVEIIICFPTFLLLLILMVILMDRNFTQSILIVIAVIGWTGWTGLSRLIRGEVLKQRIMPYIQSAQTAGIPTWRIMLFHLLPNVTGAISAESTLSFLGFGVQDPTASWGELMRQAFSDPFTNWHLTLWPGLIIFITVISFNLLGDGIKRFITPK